MCPSTMTSRHELHTVQYRGDGGEGGGIRSGGESWIRLEIGVVVHGDSGGGMDGGDINGCSDDGDGTVKSESSAP